MIVTSQFILHFVKAINAVIAFSVHLKIKISDVNKDWTCKDKDKD